MPGPWIYVPSASLVTTSYHYFRDAVSVESRGIGRGVRPRGKKENLVVYPIQGNWDGTNCTWFMDADEDHRPWNYSVNYQGMAGYPAPPGIVLPPAWSFGGY